jgi:hypothetical protein
MGRRLGRKYDAKPTEKRRVLVKRCGLETIWQKLRHRFRFDRNGPIPGDHLLGRREFV